MSKLEGSREDNDGAKGRSRRRSVWWWMTVVVDMLMVTCSQTVGTLLGRLYYNSGGNSKWMATLAVSSGAPLLVIPLLLTPEAHRAAAASTMMMVAIYAGLGILIGLNNLTYSYALLYLPVSTFSLLAATQLGFNAVSSRLIDAQRFTPLVANSVVVLTFSAALLAVGSSSDATASHVPRGKYPSGFVLTLAASAVVALVLSLFELTFEKGDPVQARRCGGC